MEKIKNLFLVAVACVAGFLGGQASTLVSAHGGDTTRIHSCVNPNSGEIKIVNANATCPSTHWISLDWNIQGEPGPAGPPGPPGPTASSEIPFICPGCNLTEGFDWGVHRLAGKDLTNAYLFQVTLNGIDLQGTKFNGAYLGGGSTLNDANATNASFANAFMEGTEFTNAILVNVDFTGTYLYLAKNLSTADLTGAVWSNTTCPDGSNSDNNGGTCLGHLNP